MWIITNLETNETLLFSNVAAWQNYVDYADWHNYNIRFATVVKSEDAEPTIITKKRVKD